MTKFEPHSNEAESLQTHVAVCHERYRALHKSLQDGSHKMAAIDQRVTRIEKLLWTVVVFLAVTSPQAKDLLMGLMS